MSQWSYNRPVEGSESLRGATAVVGILKSVGVVRERDLPKSGVMQHVVFGRCEVASVCSSTGFQTAKAAV